MVKYYVAGLFLCLSVFLQAQVPVIEFQKCIGGSNTDHVGSITVTTKVFLKNNKGNIIVGGNSMSVNGDINGAKGGFDAFIGELDKNNNWIWKKNYGGSGDDMVASVQPGIDSGYIVAVTSLSTDGEAVGNHGSRDVNIIRIGDTGNVIWSKCYGGSKSEEAGYITKVQKSGYIFIATTLSIDGDVPGIHVDSLNPQNPDIWIVRLDDSGNKTWSKTYGGTGRDVGVIIKPVEGNGFIAAGRIGSQDFDAIGNHGYSDSWLAKINDIGEIEWSKCYGGSSEEFLADVEVTGEGYVFCGFTESTDGDLSNVNSVKQKDGWVVKVNKNGKIIWQKTVGAADLKYWKI